MNRIIRFFARAVERAPLALIIGAVALTLLFGFLSSQSVVTTGNEGFAPENEEIAASERIGVLFGEGASESVIQVVVRNEGGDVISADGLQAVLAATAAVQESELAPSLVDRPERPGIASFLSPVLQAVAEQGIDPLTLTDEQVDAFYTQALSQVPPEQAGFVTGLLAEGSDPSTAHAEAGLMVLFVAAPEGEFGEDAFDEQVAAETSMADAIAALDTGDVEVLPFSFNLLFSSQDEFLGEIGRLFGLAALIILVILGFVYWMKPRGNATVGRSLRRTMADVGLTMATILMAIIWMQGLGELLVRAGIVGSFNEITQIVPILLIGLGVDYGIHITSRYREEVGQGRTVDRGMGRAIGTVGIALALATLTTMVGFLTNAFNPVPALADFGILAAVGILAAFLLMLTFVPSVRVLLDRRGETNGTVPVDGFGATGDRLLPALMERASVLAERIPIQTLLVTLVLGGFGVYGLTQLETEFSITDFLPEDAPAVATLNYIQEAFGGGFGETTQILIEGNDLATAEGHNAMVDVWANMADTEDVVTFDGPGGPVAVVTSPVSIISSLIQPGPDGDPLVPEVAGAAGTVGLGPDLKVAPGTDVSPLWDAAFAAAPEEMAGVAHLADSGAVDATLFTISTQAGERGASDLREALLEDVAPVTGGELATAIPTSQNIITAVIIEALSSSQVSSLLITVLVAGLVLVVNFWFENRRPFLGVITTIPVALVVLWTFGLMWLTGIPFGPVTATLAALAVGIGIPYTIHIARRFEEDRVRFSNLEDALRSTTRHTGGALAGSAFTTAAGFGILMTSSLKPFQQMGQVTAYAILLSLAAAVLVLPSLLALWEGYHRRRGRGPAEPARTSVPA
ncbi:MAG TPA: MMPL family transporter [Acidimicrobiia bacterium]|nr:MMPL family transporter [Acidimicrobiia bacterium]